MQELKVKNVTWISLVSPTDLDIRKLSKRVPEINQLVLEDLLTPTRRSRVENYDRHLYMILHIPHFQKSTNKVVTQELDFILVGNTLITVEYDNIPLITNLWRICMVEGAIKDRYGKTPIHLFYYIMRQLYASAMLELEALQGEIDVVEEEIFAGHEKEVLRDISLLKRNILDFRRTLKPQHMTLDALLTLGANLSGEKIVPLLTSLLSEYLKVWNLLENEKETLDSLYETNNSLLAAKINETMRAFTVLAFITFIPNVITSIYSMNFKDIPFVGWPHAFYGLLVIMAVLSWMMYKILKWKKLV